MRAAWIFSICLFMASALACCCPKMNDDNDGGAPVNNGGKPAPKSQPDDPVSKLPQTLKQKHQGRNAEQWGEELLDSDLRTSQAAALALREMGEEGLRFTYAGFTSRHQHVRKNAVFLALADEAKNYPDVFLPALKRLLQDESAEIRGYTALMIGRMPFSDGLEAVREAERKEANKEAKRQMGEAIKLLAKK